jgi:hypothetical protein
MKMKPDIVLEWDGNEETILSWVKKVKFINQQGPIVFQQLGQIILIQLVGKAADWFFLLTQTIQHEYQYN